MAQPLDRAYRDHASPSLVKRAPTGDLLDHTQPRSQSILSTMYTHTHTLSISHSWYTVIAATYRLDKFSPVGRDDLVVFFDSEI